MLAGIYLDDNYKRVGKGAICSLDTYFGRRRVVFSPKTVFLIPAESRKGVIEGVLNDKRGEKNTKGRNETIC